MELWASVSYGVFQAGKTFGAGNQNTWNKSNDLDFGAKFTSRSALYSLAVFLFCLKGDR